MRLRLPAIALLSGALLLPVGGAQAQTVQGRLASIEVHGLFGDDLPFHDAFAPLLVQVQNHTDRTFRGEVVVEARQWQGPPQTHRIPLDLPPHASRRVTLDVFFTGATTTRAQYVVDGERIASTDFTPGYAPADQAIVVLADPPRLRAALLDLEVDQTAPPDPYGGGGSTTTVRMPVGAVPLDPATGDPILPTQAVGWSTTALVVASAPDLARIGPAEQRALTDWLRTGGQLLVFLRTDGDLREPFLRSLAGDVEKYQDEPGSDARLLVPEGARGTYLRGGDADFRTEAYGGSRRLGFGRVHVAAYDGASPPYVEAIETRALVRSIAGMRRQWGVERPLLPFGRRGDAMGTNWWDGTPAFSVLRAALDPNEVYRPALGLVAVVLLLYVIVVGPVNFAFVAKRNRPTLALATTPVAACGCLAVMLGVGYIGKGTTMRYRAVEVVELAEGDSAGPARRYSGLFLTRPATFDLESPERGIASIVRLPSADLAPVVDHGGDRPVLRGARGRLWETIFVREDRIADLGGGIHFDRSGQRLAGVRNDSGVTLRGAVVVDGGGPVYRVGTVPPGGRAAIAQVSEMSMGTDPVFWGEEDPQFRQLAAMMGLSRDEHRVLDGASKLLGGTLSVPETPVLYGWVEVEGRDEVAGTFAREMDLQLVRVVPRVEAARVVPVYDENDTNVPEDLP